MFKVEYEKPLDDSYPIKSFCYEDNGYKSVLKQYKRYKNASPLYKLKNTSIISNEAEYQKEKK